MRNRILYIFILFAVNACISDSSDSGIDIDPEMEKFIITVGKDTVIKSSEGVEIHINKSSFQSQEREIELNIKTAISKAKMLSEGLATVTSDNRLLDSDGMIFIQSNPPTKIDSTNPIRVKIPQLRISSEMRLFKGSETNGHIIWDEISELKNQLQEDVALGKYLFQEHCTACHREDLRSKLIGPVLGNVTLFRDSAFLFAFTRNSVQMITEGHPLAICLFKQFNKQAMSPFPNLSDKDLSSIYAFIESESRNQGISIQEISFTDSCYRDSGNIVFLNQNGNIIQTSQISNAISFSGDIQQDIISSMKFYEFDIKDYGWYNIDLYIGTNSDIIENFRFSIPADTGLEVKGFVVFKNRNVIIPLEFSEQDKYYYFLLGQYKESVEFPIGIEMQVIAVAESDSSNLFGSLNIISKKEGNQYTLELKPTNEKDIRLLIKQE